MTKERLAKRMDSMKGKTFLYMAKRQKVLYFINSEADDVVFIVTDKTHHRVSNDRLDKYLNDFVGPVEDENLLPAVSKQSAFYHQFVVDTQTITSLKDTLLENIKAVKANKDFIPQAFEINQQIKTLIKLAETEVELHRINLD